MKIDSMLSSNKIMFPIKKVLSFMKYPWQLYYRSICRGTYIDTNSSGIYQQTMVNGHLFSYDNSGYPDEYDDNTEIGWSLEGSNEPIYKKYITFNETWPHLSAHVSWYYDRYMAIIRYSGYDVYTYDTNMVDPNRYIDIKNGLVFSYKHSNYSLSYLSDEDLAEERTENNTTFVRINDVNEALRLCCICDYPDEVQICFDPVAKKIDHIFMRADDNMIFYWSKDTFKDTVNINNNSNDNTVVAIADKPCPFDILIWDLIMSHAGPDDLRTCCMVSLDIWKASTRYIDDRDYSWVIHEGRSIVTYSRDVFGYYDTISGSDYFFEYLDDIPRVYLNGFNVCGNYEAAIKIRCRDICGDLIEQRTLPIVEQITKIFKDRVTSKKIKITYEDADFVDFKMIENNANADEECDIFIVPNMMDLLTNVYNHCQFLIKFADDGTIEAILCHLKNKRLHRNICFVGFKNE